MNYSDEDKLKIKHSLTPLLTELLFRFSNELNYKAYIESNFNYDAYTIYAPRKRVPKPGHGYEELFKRRLLKRNAFIHSELYRLDTLNVRIIRDLDNFGLNVYDIHEVIKFYPADNKGSERFIEWLRSVSSSESDRTERINNKLKKASTAEFLYYFFIIQIDLCKIYEFLLDKFDPDMPIPEKKSEKIGTLTQTVLYHYILQEQGIEPRIQHRQNDCAKLAAEYGFSGWKSFSTKHSDISNNKIGAYRNEDLQVVYNALKASYPEAIPVFREVTKASFYD